MTYLADTHVLIWALVEPNRLSPRHRAVLADTTDVKFVSTVSFWEMSVKFGLGKLRLENADPESLLGSCVEAGFHVLPLDPSDAATSWRLPRVDDHRDPFDRLLIWQCIRNDIVFLSSDGEAEAYREHGLTVVA